jgi:hypothetical protein
MWRVLANAVALLVFTVGLIGSPRGGSTAVAGSAPEDREILAQCVTSLGEGPKLITNLAPVSVPKTLTTVRDVTREVERRAGDTLRRLGMTNDQHPGCYLSDPTLPWVDGNNPEAESIDFRNRLEQQGYKLVHVDRLDEARAEAAAEAGAGAGAGFYCEVRVQPAESYETRTFETNLSESEVGKQWTEYVTEQGFRDYRWAECHKEYPDRTPASWITYHYLTWAPKDSSPDAGTRKTKSVLFRSAHSNERGYRGVTFDVEYEFIACSGELHIAYSIVENSVRKAPGNIGGYGPVLYSLAGHTYPVSPPPKTILNLPLKGRVFPLFNHVVTIGTFADDNAGKALGMGCFSGQTQKIADIKDLRDENGQQPSKEYLPKLLNLLDASFETTQVLTSAEAEDEIRAGHSKEAAAKDEQAGKSAEERRQTDQGPSEADLRAQRRAQEEAEFQAKQKAYEERMAAHDAAVEQYKKALADMEAQKVANAVAAKAQQEEFARKQAAYEAEAAKAKQAQDEYEAKYGKAQ